MSRILVTRDNFVFPFGMLLNPTDSEIPFMPEVVEEVEELPGCDGAVQLASRYAPTEHVLVMRSWPEATEEEKDYLKRQVKTVIAAARAASIELHYERTGLTYYVRYVGQPEKVQEFAGWVEFRIPLTAHDPYGYDPNEKYMEANGHIDNRGNESTPARIVVKGPATSPSVRVNGTTYSYSGTVPTGSTLYVEPASSSAYLRDAGGVKTNVTRNWCGRFLMLQPGFSTVEGISTGNLSIRWHNRWA